eukprot:TRINITY_DN9843_c0_g1_i1.p1 TRINITY_DN9843_c0_g1~~TRINITY_DN9843_c0_g1_i1.p1  ORF type:complete len:107 (+),score=20.92 TRINITY_DN9843_c0_g1_i1:41-322(+)
MSTNDQQNNEQPGLIASHAEYVKGAAESVIGSITGSQAWTESGEQAKAHAVESMKAASENRDQTQGYGKIEEIAGKVTGCQGMEKEGAASKKE